MSKLPWESLPADRVAAVEELTGPVIKAESAADGLMPGMAAVLHTGTGRYFLKAVPVDSPAASLYEREMRANAGLPRDVPSPRTRYSSAGGGWLVMPFDYLEAARTGRSRVEYRMSEPGNRSTDLAVGPPSERQSTTVTYLGDPIEDAR